MPSRKRSKGQARKAKAKANANIVCYHGTQSKDCLPLLSVKFIKAFLRSLQSFAVSTHYSVVQGANLAVKSAHAQFPEALNNEMHRDVIKKALISEATSILNDNEKAVIVTGFAAALMVVDSYNLSSEH